MDKIMWNHSLYPLTRNTKSQRYSARIALTILSSRQRYKELRLALHSTTTAITVAMSGPTASNPLDVCRVVVATCIIGQFQYLLLFPKHLKKLFLIGCILIYLSTTF
jgi:hypothetical protein